MRIRGKFTLTESQHSLEPSEDYTRLPLQVMPESLPSELAHRKAILLCFVVILSCDIQRIRCLFQLGDYQSESIRVYPSAVKSFSGFLQRERFACFYIVRCADMVKTGFKVSKWSRSQDLIVGENDVSHNWNYVSNH